MTNRTIFPFCFRCAGCHRQTENSEDQSEEICGVPAAERDDGGEATATEWPKNKLVLTNRAVFKRD